MNVQLLLHNVGWSLSSAVVLALAAFVFFKGRRKTANITLALAFISIAVFTISHLIGVNIADSELSRQVLMLNLSVIFITLFLAHSVFAVVGITKQQKITLIVFYAVSIGMTIFYLLFPETFLKTSVPKLYFPNYYVPGNLQWVMRLVSDVIIPIYFLWILAKEYFRAESAMKNRIKYLFIALFLGYVVGSLAILLVYDIPVDPLLAGPFMLLFAIPFAYGVTYHKLLDINIVARRAFLYAVLVTSGSLILVAINYANEFVTRQNQGVPVWIFPFIASAFSVGIGYFVFLKIRETDMLKAQFTKIIMHKFRTPVTQIRWSIAQLKDNHPKFDQVEAFDIISQANNRLVELIDLLSYMAETEKSKRLTHATVIDLTELVSKIVKRYEPDFRQKDIRIMANDSGPSPIKVDSQELGLAIETILDNALLYTPRDGWVTVTISAKDHTAHLTITDSGIGIHSDELPYIFTKFFRGSNAQKVDTEGLGIGLFLAKSIITGYGGTITATSGGSNQGTTFTITFPLVR